MILAGCTSTRQHMDLSASEVATPPHSMSRHDYPFDADGRYVESWAAQGAVRYPGAMRSDPKPSRSSSRLASKPSADKPTKAKKGTTTVTVKKGDTLSGLSRRYNSSVSAIRRANALKSNMLRVGQRLVIPR